MENLLGDILLSVGSISYLGAFTGAFRERIVNDMWIPKVIEEKIICSKPFSLTKTLGDPIKIQNWLLSGLPLDNSSIENTIIMNASPL
jgi:dynein heavy chain